MLILSPAEAQTLTMLKRVPAAGELRGAAGARDGRIITWGDGLYAWNLPSLAPQCSRRVTSAKADAWSISTEMAAGIRVGGRDGTREAYVAQTAGLEAGRDR